MKKVLNVAALVLLAVGALLIALNLHEMGHTLAARAAGDSGAMYFLYRNDPHTGTCIGCNVYDETRLSYGGNLWVTVAGVLTTQVIAFGLWLWGVRKEPHSLQRRLALLIALVFMVDVPLQVLQALFADVAKQAQLTRVDLADTLYLVMQRAPVSALTLKAVLVGCMLAYAFLVAFVYARGKRRRGFEMHSSAAV
jgi:hypothetical protein